ncbi:MAG TPA: hypothetical protein VGG41_03945 [Solirubrobacteraceae bacterium]
MSVTPDLHGGGVGWCVATSLYSQLGGGGGMGCGYAPLPERPIVAVGGGSGSARAGDIYSATTEYVYVTTRQVAAVRVSPKLTILTRTDRQLPDDYRVAIDIQQTIAHHRLNTPPPGQPQPAVALSRTGRQIGLPASDAGKPEDFAVFWSSAATQRPPAGACEIDMNGLHGAFGLVVPHVRGFPELSDRAFLSCASTQTANGQGLGAVAAILLDAQHPGSKPTALPDAKPVPGHPQTFNEAGIAAPAEPHATPPPRRQVGRRHPLNPPRPTSTSITGRRIGNAWLVVQAGGTLPQRLAILDRLAVCVHLSGSPCPGSP